MTARPTHRNLKSAALVFAHGYDLIDLERLPVDYWPTCDHAEAMAAMRGTRNKLLLLTDPTQAADRKAEIKALWAPYREALRTLPDSFDPANPVWPEPPFALTTLT